LPIALALLVMLLSGLLPLAQPAHAQPAAAGEWAQYRHDPQRSGRASAALPVSGASRLHLQWAYSFGERVEIEVEPIVAAGKVFAGAMNGTFTALNAADGSVAWTFEAGPIPHTAAYADGRVFFGSLDGYVYGLDAASGALAWKFQTGGPVYAAPALAGGVVYIGSTTGRFFALDAASGSLLIYDAIRDAWDQTPAQIPGSSYLATTLIDTDLYLLGSAASDGQAIFMASFRALYQSQIPLITR
jgi:outer membrane protein assembly factor BamB